MGVYCTECGEELLGAVNRCWRCGAAFKPAIAASPVQQEPIEALLIDEQTSDQAATTISPEGNEGHNSSSPQPVGAPIRRGSPFADWYIPSTAKSAGREHASSPGPLRGSPPQSPQHAAAAGAAVSSVFLGATSLLALSLSAVVPLVTAMLGVLLGIWGLFSTRKGLAIIGLVLCCLVLIIAGFLCGVIVYEKVYRENPFEESPPIDDVFEDEFRHLTTW